MATNWATDEAEILNDIRDTLSSASQDADGVTTIRALKEVAQQLSEMKPVLERIAFALEEQAGLHD